jgi:hypothetical protein
LSVKIFLSKAKLVDGSLRTIEHDRVVSWEVEFAEIDPQDLVNQEEKAVRNIVEKIGESIAWGPEQKVALLRFEEWKGEYVRMEDGEALVDEIDRQDGWYISNVSIIFDAPCLFLHHLLIILLHFVALLCIFRD